MLYSLAYSGKLNSRTVMNSRDVNQLANMATMSFLGFLLCSYCVLNFKIGLWSIAVFVIALTYIKFL